MRPLSYMRNPWVVMETNPDPCVAMVTDLVLGIRLMAVSLSLGPFSETLGCHSNISSDEITLMAAFMSVRTLSETRTPWIAMVTDLVLCFLSRLVLPRTVPVRVRLYVQNEAVSRPTEVAPHSGGIHPPSPEATRLLGRRRGVVGDRPVSPPCSLTQRRRHIEPMLF